MSITKLFIYSSKADWKCERNDFIDGQCYDTVDTEFQFLEQRGHFDDGKWYRRLVDNCRTVCFDYKYTALRPDQSCWCVDELPCDRFIRHVDECNSPCTKGSQEKCGATNRMNIYTTFTFDQNTCITFSGKVFKLGASIIKDY